MSFTQPPPSAGPALRVPLVDLRANYLPIREELQRSFDQVFEDMQLFLGPHQRAFEREFAAYCGTAHGVALSNGTDALFAALHASGVGPGDEVITPSHTFFATIEAIVHTGATPVLVDVEPGTLTIDVEEVRGALTAATRAIVPVHLYGQPADMAPLSELAAANDLRLIEDSAQAHGARYRDRRCGALGDAGCFSFYCTKNLGALGEGGFLATDDAELAERVRRLRHHGHVSKFEHGSVGYNLRMDELQAAVLRLKLPRLDACNERRRRHARRYRERLEGGDLRLLEMRPDGESVHHLFPIRVDERRRDALRDGLAESGVGTGIHYAIPAHLQPALARHPLRRGKMEVTERACRELVSLPMYPELEDAAVDYVADRVLELLRR